MSPSKERREEIERLIKQWRKKEITYAQIPTELREAVTGRSPSKAVTK